SNQAARWQSDFERLQELSGASRGKGRVVGILAAVVGLGVLAVVVFFGAPRLMLVGEAKKGMAPVVEPAAQPTPAVRSIAAAEATPAAQPTPAVRSIAAAESTP